MKNKKAVLAAVLLLLICAIVLRPINIGKSVISQNDIEIRFSRLYVENGEAKQKWSSVEAEYGSDEYYKTAEILSKYKCCGSAAAIFDKSTIYSPQTVMIMCDGNFVTFTEGGKLFLNGKIYTLGFNGAKKSAEILEELKKAVSEN